MEFKIWHIVHRCARFYYIIECNDRKYGDGCQRKCGLCLNMTQCDHVNGTCSQGCEAGYQGQMCEQGQWHVIRKLFETLIDKFFMYHLRNQKKFST